METLKLYGINYANYNEYISNSYDASSATKSTVFAYILPRLLKMKDERPESGIMKAIIRMFEIFGYSKADEKFCMESVIEDIMLNRANAKSLKIFEFIRLFLTDEPLSKLGKQEA